MDKKRNVKTIRFELVADKKVSLINNTPTLRRMFHTPVHIGVNTHRVNHAMFSQINNMFGMIGVEVKEISNKNKIAQNERSN